MIDPLRLAELKRIAADEAELPPNAPVAASAALFALLLVIAAVIAATFGQALLSAQDSAELPLGDLAFRGAACAVSLGFAWSHWQRGPERARFDARGVELTNWRGRTRRFGWEELRELRLEHAFRRISRRSYTLRLRAEERFDLDIDGLPARVREPFLAGLLVYALERGPADLALRWRPRDARGESDLSAALCAMETSA